MKSKVIIFHAVFLCAVAFNNNLSGQTIEVDLLNKNSLLFTDSKYFNNPDSSNYGIPTLRRVNARAMRNLLKKHFDVDSVYWFENGKGSVARFNSNGVIFEIQYNKQGHRLVTKKTYKGDKLPIGVLNLVKRNYVEFEIATVVEFEMLGKNIYYLNMQDRTSWVQVRIMDKELEVLKQFNK